MLLTFFHGQLSCYSSQIILRRFFLDNSYSLGCAQNCLSSDVRVTTPGHWSRNDFIANGNLKDTKHLCAEKPRERNSGETLAKNFADFRPDMSRKIGRKKFHKKIGGKFHEPWKNLSPQDSGSLQARKTLENKNDLRKWLFQTNSKG